MTDIEIDDKSIFSVNAGVSVDTSNNDPKMSDKIQDAILSRFRAGDSIADIADDLGIPQLEVEQHIRSTGCVEVPEWIVIIAVTNGLVLSCDLACEWIRSNYYGLSDLSREIINSALASVREPNGVMPESVQELIDDISNQGSQDAASDHTKTSIASTAWLRCRFRANETDPRPINWPPPGPYWITGYGDGYSVIVAYCQTIEQVTEYWPEATDIDAAPKAGIEFSDRFPNTFYRKREEPHAP
jgi:hypothetical protein